MSSLCDKNYKTKFQCYSFLTQIRNILENKSYFVELCSNETVDLRNKTIIKFIFYCDDFQDPKCLITFSIPNEDFIIPCHKNKTWIMYNAETTCNFRLKLILICLIEKEFEGLIKYCAPHSVDLKTQNRLTVSSIELFPHKFGTELYHFDIYEDPITEVFEGIKTSILSFFYQTPYKLSSKIYTERFNKIIDYREKHINKLENLKSKSYI